jgi:3-hydroxyisobutyrate dehydrogenase-like beta-hydroxyacid dehydrogenase
MSTIKTIAFLYPGAMGTALAALLHERAPHLRLLTSVAGRSSSTVERASAAGLVNVPLTQLVAEADILLSVLPPSAALPLAEEVSALLQTTKRTTPLIYVDANAVAPATMDAIAHALGPDVPLIDASIIGLPPAGAKEPAVYLAAEGKWTAQLDAVARALGGENGERWGKVRILKDAGAGAASALKMCYGGLAKGTIGLAALLILCE